MKEGKKMTKYLFCLFFYTAFSLFFSISISEQELHSIEKWPSEERRKFLELIKLVYCDSEMRRNRLPRYVGKNFGHSETFLLFHNIFLLLLFLRSPLWHTKWVLKVLSAGRWNQRQSVVQWLKEKIFLSSSFYRLRV